MLVHGAGRQPLTQLGQAASNPQELANGGWSPLDEQNAAFMVPLIEQATACAMDFSASQLRQLFQSMLWFTLRHRLPQPRFASAAGSLAAGEPATQGLTHAAGCARRDPPAARLLCAISEHGTDDNLFSIDIALQLPGDQKLPVEVDGPDLSNTPCPGATRLRNHVDGWRRVAGDDEWDGTARARRLHTRPTWQPERTEAPGWQSIVACVLRMWPAPARHTRGP
jgi:hypothetical protein